MTIWSPSGLNFEETLMPSEEVLSPYDILDAMRVQRALLIYDTGMRRHRPLSEPTLEMNHNFC